MPFATTFCDLRNHRLPNIVPGRSEPELRRSLPRLRGRVTVRAVCIDLSSPYRALVRKWFPNARLIPRLLSLIKGLLQSAFEPLVGLCTKPSTAGETPSSPCGAPQKTTASPKASTEK